MEESEDEDFEDAATKRVHEAIYSILNEEEDEGMLQYVPPEKQSVYFAYTEEGAVREDPDETAKKEKNKKNRLKSAKRPLTGKKKKVDIAGGDIVKMAETAGGAHPSKKKKDFFPKAQGLVKQ